MDFGGRVRSIFFGSCAVVVGMLVVIIVKGVVSLFSNQFLFWLLFAACAGLVISALLLILIKGDRYEAEN